MRKILAGLVAVFAALSVSLAQGTAAFAADGVSDGRCYESGTSVGRACLIAIFDNTNCDANSTNNCSGLNGANLRQIQIQINSGTISTRDVPITLDTYGDGTNAYVSTWTVNLTQDGPYLYYANIASSFPGNINRVCVKIRASGSTFNIGGVNPYGLSQAGACGI